MHRVEVGLYKYRVEVGVSESERRKLLRRRVTCSVGTVG